jgi:hypothetical protein
MFKGLSFYVSFGRYAGFRVHFGNPTLLRICLGWVAISIMTLDLDELYGNLIDKHIKALEFLNQVLEVNYEAYGKAESLKIVRNILNLNTPRK